MRQTGPRQVTLWRDGAVRGGADWAWAALGWGRERVTVARLTRLDCPQAELPALWAYLDYLFAPLGVAAVQTPDGALRWYHQALEADWRAAGSPTQFSQP